MSQFVESLKTVAKLCFERAGIRLDGEIVPRPGQSHQIVTPRATYSPWNLDPVFLETFAVIRPYTLVDLYRCYDLWTLVSQTAKLGRGSLIEVGVWKGGTGAMIAKSAAVCALSDPVYLCDTFTGIVKAGPRDTRYKGSEHSDASRAGVERLLKSLGLQRVHILEGVFPEETGAMIQDQSFRFCHVDVDVYRSAHDVLEWIWPRLVCGAVVVYDDYGFHGCDGVAAHVDEQARLEDRIVLCNLNGHAIIVKTHG